MDLGHILLVILILAVIGSAGIIVLELRQKGIAPDLRADPKWGTNPEGKLLEELERVRSQIVEVGARVAGYVQTASSTLNAGTAYAPKGFSIGNEAPAAPALTELADAYIDRDDLMKALGRTNFSRAVYLDNVLVHNATAGAVGPATFFASHEGTPNQSLTRVKAA